MAGGGRFGGAPARFRQLGTLVSGLKGSDRAATASILWVTAPLAAQAAAAEHRLDDAEHRLRGVLAQGVQRPALGRLQPMRHRLDRRRIARWWRRQGRSARPAAGGAAGVPSRSADQSAPPRRPARWPRWNSQYQPAAFRPRL